jgi:long-chain acyl-CoA synthetase
VSNLKTIIYGGAPMVAFVVKKAGATVTAAELDELCLKRLARFKRPRQYVFVDKLPTNTTGKVLKSVLRESLPSIEQDIHYIS